MRNGQHGRLKIVRFKRIRQRIQPILNLARLFPDRIERTRIAGGIQPARSAKGVGRPKVVPCCASYLRHFLKIRCRCAQQVRGFDTVGGERTVRLEGIYYSGGYGEPLFNQDTLVGFPVASVSTFAALDLNPP